ncbi:hypothetical protein, partial [Stenotrophomonas maltophilia]|uniref:hypothetical protein n=1 Tax=Stenotrophomonas maltophilia TaxID=40324 RepID=UPI000AFAE8F8
LGRGIHAADTPANPPRPTSDSFRVRPATEKKKENQSQNQTLVASLLVAAQGATHQFVMIRPTQQTEKPEPLWLWLLRLPASGRHYRG